MDLEDKQPNVDNQNFQHNWLYSVLPIRPSYYDMGNNSTVVPSDQFVLSGYCRACDQAFAVPLNISQPGGIQTTKVGVPKWGCVNPMAI